jgi:hypothetical protein
MNLNSPKRQPQLRQGAQPQQQQQQQQQQHRVSSESKRSSVSIFSRASPVKASNNMKKVLPSALSIDAPGSAAGAATIPSRARLLAAHDSFNSTNTSSSNNNNRSNSNNYADFAAVNAG